jgi:hypothetical protein
VFHLGKLLHYAKKTILSWKGMQGTKTLAYYENFYFTAVKSFITLAPGPRRVALLQFESLYNLINTFIFRVSETLIRMNEETCN